MGRGQGSCSISYNAQMRKTPPSPAKIYLSQNVSSILLEKPCLKGIPAILGGIGILKLQTNRLSS